MAKQTFTTGQVLTAAQMTSLQQTAMGGGSPSTKTASYVLVAADAGTTIQMNSSSATTITVNTSLFSAGDSLQIQNIGTGNVTITAGTATVNTAGGLAVTQWDGGFLYFSSASSAIWFDYTQSGLTNPMTTTGDMIYASSGSTPARLGIGSTGQVLTVASGVPSWATPASGSTFVGASVYMTAAQSIANNSFVTLLFNAENFDTDAFHDNATNNSRLTVPTGKAGKYLITLQGNIDSSITGVRYAYIKLNGSTVVSKVQLAPATSGNGWYVNQSVVQNLIVGDYVEAQLLQDSGGSLNSQGGVWQNVFSISYLGA